MKSLYSIVDHRAPRYILRMDPCVQVMQRFIVVAILLLAAVGLGIGAMAGGSLICAALCLIASVVLQQWLAAWNRHVIRLDDDDTTADYRIQRDLAKMQVHYARHPGLQPLMEPVLIASYGLARNLQDDAVEQRLRAITELADSARSPDPEVDNADLDELRNILAIRRQMRSEGLL